ncbi:MULTISPECIES: chromosomal replication initiator protein DnaA [Cohaesibacter]|uniref:chromosomal replication initiator protein DnaA n=1 Tax=Cohaesibacter TaxID=655352 RepID=UPI001FE11C75|nr:MULTISPECIES: chromosomal replication initiator protein DnaA [Cohaesibacter]
MKVGKEDWERVKKRLQAELGEDVFSSWFASVELESEQNGLVTLSVSTRFLKSWIQSHYGDLLMALWREECEQVRRIDLYVRGAVRPKPVAAKQQPQQADAAAKDGGFARPQGGMAAIDDQDHGGGSPLDPRLTFDTFVVGQSNTLAHAAAKQVAMAQPGQPVSFNPLFLHASVGLGKTHLLQAIAWEAKKSNPTAKVLYLTAERFMYSFVQALKSQSALDFKDTLRDIDILLIDDLQFLQGKSIQQEFCHTLNSLIDGARQVVVAADRPPVELESLDERVRSRLAGGLVSELQPLEKELRRSILADRATNASRRDPNLAIPELVLDHVAGIIRSNGRDLDGAFNRLMAHNQLTGAPISIEMAEQALKDLIRSKEPRRIRIEDIQRVVSKHYNVSRSDLLSSRRTRTIVRPRQIAMYLSKMLTPRSLPEIGRRFGGRDHTTVLHAVRKIEELAGSDNALQQEIEMLKRNISE